MVAHTYRSTRKRERTDHVWAASSTKKVAGSETRRMEEEDRTQNLGQDLLGGAFVCLFKLLRLSLRHGACCGIKENLVTSTRYIPGIKLCYSSASHYDVYNIVEATAKCC